jgi:hypothetical protein
MTTPLTNKARAVGSGIVAWTPASTSSEYVMTLSTEYIVSNSWNEFNVAVSPDIEKAAVNEL